jgi:hypothetical protein
MRWINLLSLTVLTGIVFGIRCLVIPSIESMPRTEGVRLMGKLMPRARRQLALGLIFFLGSAIAQLALGDLTPAAGANEMIARATAILVTVVLVPLTLSPHRRISLRIERHRKTLLTIALILLIAQLILSV